MLLSESMRLLNKQRVTYWCLAGSALKSPVDTLLSVINGRRTGSRCVVEGITSTEY